VKPTKRVFDNTKVSDHFAIIPTLQAPKSLTEIELKLYDMVVKRFLAVFYPSAEFMVTTRISTVKLPRPTPFQTNGKVLVNAGWLAVYGKEAQDDDANLVAVAPGEMVRTESVDVLALKTKPPARYTEATLLSAMEGAGKLIEDEELRDAMKEKGLGTPATRAQTIEGLIAEKYMLRDGRELVPTAKAFQLMTLLRGLAIEDLTRPDLTGNWEYQLSEMEHGRLSRQAFMAEIAQMAERIVKKAKEYDRDTIPGDYATLATPCPNCGGVVKENYRRFGCTGARRWTKAAVFPSPRSRPDAPSKRWRPKPSPRQEDRPAGRFPLQGGLALFRRDQAGARRRDQQLEAGVRLRRRRRQAEGDGEPVDFSAQSLGACPKCQGHVYEHGSNYVCEHSVGATVTCDFKTGKIILQQPVSHEEVHKLLATGKTSLLENFVSNKTRRKFKAFLAWDKKEGKVGFEFEPRAAKVPAKAAPRRRPRSQPPRKRRREPGPGPAWPRGAGCVLALAVAPAGQAHRGGRLARRGAARAPGRAAGGRQGQCHVAGLAGRGTGLPAARPEPAARRHGAPQVGRDRPAPGAGGGLAGPRAGRAVTEAVAIRLAAILATVALGWIAARAGWLGRGAPGRDTTAADLLGKAAFYLFVPALLFRTMVRLDLSTLPWRLLAAYFVPAVVAFTLLVYAWQRRRGPTQAAEAATRSVAMVYGNGVQLGIPMAAALFGEPAWPAHGPGQHARPGAADAADRAGGNRPGARQRRPHARWQTLRSTVRNTVCTR
jgi:hypothetical protein